MSNCVLICCTLESAFRQRLRVIKEELELVLNYVCSAKMALTNQSTFSDRYVVLRKINKIRPREQVYDFKKSGILMSVRFCEKYSTCTCLCTSCTYF